jgi:hypothetical protein
MDKPDRSLKVATRVRIPLGLQSIKPSSMPTLGLALPWGLARTLLGSATAKLAVNPPPSTPIEQCHRTTPMETEERPADVRYDGTERLPFYSVDSRISLHAWATFPFSLGPSTYSDGHLTCIRFVETDPL